MACFDRVSLGFLLHLCLWLFHQVDGTVINIYSSLEPYSILANLSRPGWTNYTLEASNTRRLLILSIDSTNGLLRMIRKPDCTSLQLNPFNTYVSSTSIFNSAERTLRPLTVTIFGKNCCRKLQRKVSWTAPVGTRVPRKTSFMKKILRTKA